MGEVKVIGQIMKENRKKEPSFKDVEPAREIVNFDEIFCRVADSLQPNYQVNEVIKTLVQYFLGFPKFDEYKLVENTADINKGLLVYGTYGVGKSLFFQIMNQVGKEVYSNLNNRKFLFGSQTAPWIVSEHMNSTKPGYTGNFRVSGLYTGRLYIDDLGAEELCFNKYELMEDILFHRHRNGARTFVTTNLTPEEIGTRYGGRLDDRIGQMFNIIEWKGESFRDGPK